MTAGTEFKCSVDFLGDRTKQLLRNVKAKLLGQSITVLSPPVVCDWSPKKVDIYLEPDRRTNLELSGYDLSNKTEDGRSLRLILVNNDGSHSDKTKFFSRVSFYAAVVNIGGNGIQFDNKSKALQLFWGDQMLSEIPVIRPVID